MSDQNPPPLPGEPLTMDDMNTLGARLVLAMMRSVDPDVIKPLDWWGRARTALETAAQSSDHYSGMISAMGKKLQIDVLREESGAEVLLIGHEVAAQFDDFRRHLDTEALFVVAIAQAQRKAEKAAYGVAAKSPASLPDGSMCPGCDGCGIPHASNCNHTKDVTP